MAPPSFQRRSSCWLDTECVFIPCWEDSQGVHPLGKRLFIHLAVPQNAQWELWSAAGQVFSLSRAGKADCQLFVRVSVPPLYRQAHPAHAALHRGLLLLGSSVLELCLQCFLWQLSKSVFNPPVAHLYSRILIYVS